MYKSWMWKQRSFREQFQGDEGSGGAGGSAVAEPDEQQGDNVSNDDDQPAGAPEATGQAADAADGDDGIVISLGDEPISTANDDEIDGRPAPQWVRDLRKSDREKGKRIRELEQQVSAGKQAQQPQQIVVGEKPTLEGCEFDAERYAQEVLAWDQRKRAADEQVATARKEQETAQAAWNQRLNAYRTASAALKVPDFEDAEATVQEKLNPTQLAIIVSGAESHAALVYALGKNPAELQKLAAIKDPVQYAFAAARLEAKLKVEPRKAPPPAERQVRGTTGGKVGIDNTLARLQSEADKTGDRTAVTRYLRQQGQAA